MAIVSVKPKKVVTSLLALVSQPLLSMYLTSPLSTVKTALLLVTEATEPMVRVEERSTAPVTSRVLDKEVAPVIVVTSSIVTAPVVDPPMVSGAILVVARLPSPVR